MLLSLFSGCGGLDLGFEQVGFSTGLAYDLRPFSVTSWNHNRPGKAVGRVADIGMLTLREMDEHHGAEFKPSGVIGGPPCQSFTNANSRKRDNDPRSLLVTKFFEVALALHRRSSLDFILMENVPELASTRYRDLLDAQIDALRKAGFECSEAILNAYDYGVAQNRKRLFLVALNKRRCKEAAWQVPDHAILKNNVRQVIGHLPVPTIFSRDLRPDDIAVHENHWCMKPKSKKFGTSLLEPGKSLGRSFRMLDWERPSFTVSYGHREVHIHPCGSRRLSVYEAMLLQGFPEDFVLKGNLSQQITQVSEAVPPPLAAAIGTSVLTRLLPRALP